MKTYNIMFRNGDGVTIEGDVFQNDEGYLRIWRSNPVVPREKKSVLVAVFSWEAICGFIIEEEKPLRDTIENLRRPIPWGEERYADVQEDVEYLHE